MFFAFIVEYKNKYFVLFTDVSFAWCISNKPAESVWRKRIAHSMPSRQTGQRGNIVTLGRRSLQDHVNSISNPLRCKSVKYRVRFKLLIQPSIYFSSLWLCLNKALDYKWRIKSGKAFFFQIKQYILQVRWNSVQMEQDSVTCTGQ